MGQQVFNLVMTAYAGVSAIVIGGLYTRLNLIQRIHKQQIKFNEEVINGFSLTRKALTK